ncbi:uncharacterized protein LOC117332533 [Pecten maximus]|uniref:uncharacterized protein LOC117332533 n=1 Tax=Pecten maximus TaxID=6579 RepID=UPI00145879EB|nr:uncharacterized protein LOC117332533 [Pecten maximus]
MADTAVNSTSTRYSNMSDYPLYQMRIYTGFSDTFRFFKEHSMQPFVEEAQTYQNKLSRQMEESSIRMRLRQHYNMEKVLLVIGFKQRITCTNPSMWVWRFDYRRWYTLRSSSCKLGNGYATCRYGKSEVFFCGGQGKRTFLKFDGLTDTILPCTQMITARMSHCMACVGDSIYVLGGNGFQFEKKHACLVEDKLESVEVWRPSDATWQQCGHIMSPVSGATSCISGSLILLYGGYINQNDKEHSNLAQFYDTKTNTCGHLQANLPLKFQNLKSANVSGVTYILANNNIFESECKDKLEYNKVQSLREKCDTHSFAKHSFAMTNDEKYLYILKECYNRPIPIYDDTSWDLRQYNIATHLVENASKNIRFFKSDVSMHTLVVGKSILHEKSVVVPNSEGFLT